MVDRQRAEASQAEERRLKRYRLFSLWLVIVFAAVGLLFLFLPGGILRFFNGLSLSFGLAPSPTEGVSFFLILAVGYMALVTQLAWCMYRMPANRFFPLLLMSAKLASSGLSLIFFAVVSRTLIYLANGIVDGLLATGVFLMCLRRRSR